MPESDGDESEEVQRCPECEGEIYEHTDQHGIFWCEECQREYWQDGCWWSCDESGVAVRV